MSVICYHHESADYQGVHVEAVRCVEAANFICSQMGITSVGVQLVKFSSQAMAALMLSKEDLVVLVQDLQRELASNANLFQI
jgi:hypothetical protein